jgi:Myosin tail
VFTKLSSQTRWRIVRQWWLSAYDCDLVCDLVCYKLLTQLRELESELEDEKKQRAAAVAARKKIEGDFKSMEQQVDGVNKIKEDLLKQIKKLQVCP